LTQAVGKQKTDLLLDRVSTGQTGQGIEALKWMDAKAVAQIIGGEHPQIAALVLSHLEPEQAANILPLLGQEMRTDVLMRIASLNEVPESALTELDQLVEKQANATPSAPLRRIGGARTVANILNAMEKEQSGAELGKIEKADGEMHGQIKDLLFIFDNLLDVDDRGIQALLREVSSDNLAVALRGAEPEVQEKILKNMSKRAAEILKDDMEARGPVKLADVEAAQKEIVVIAQRLAEEGTITLGGKGGGEFV
jgi:flagellar motor switch protein FliG